MRLKTDQISQLKKIINDIIEKEKANTGIDVNIEPMTIIEYYKSRALTKKISLDRVLKPFYCGGFHDSIERNICVFLKRNNTLDFPTTLANIIITTFHEMRHAQQFNKRFGDYISYEDFVFSIEKIIQHFDPHDYFYHHDQYLFEIDANVYGVNKAIKYLEKNNLMTDENRIYLELKKKEYELDYENFDIQQVLTNFYHICKSKTVYFDSWPIQIFYNEDMSFKPINKILSNPNLKRIDKKILTSVLSSEHFLKNIDFSTLSEEQCSIIMDALKETLNTQITRRTNCIKLLQKKIIDGKKWLALDLSISNKIAYCNNSMRCILKAMMRDLSHIDMYQYYSNLSTIVNEDNLRYNKKA